MKKGLDGHTSRLCELVRRMAGRRVAVIGDVIADQFVFGEIARVSREAPVMIVNYKATETVPGGAGNAAANIASLGGAATIVSLVGRDRPGRSIVRTLGARGVDTSGVVARRAYATPTKVRILAGLAHSPKQQLIRIDQEPERGASANYADELIARALVAVDNADAAIVSDYEYGTAGSELVTALHERASARGIPVLVDSRYRLGRFVGFTSATPNESELEELVGRGLKTEVDVVEAGTKVLGDLALESLLVTRGKRGMVLVERGGGVTHIPAVGSKDAVDVTGAGDTVIATFALGLAVGAASVDAARLANFAGGLVVMKQGTATVDPAELIESIEDSGREA